LIKLVKKSLFVLIFFLVPELTLQAETSLLLTSFTANPAAVNGTVTICQGQSITYTNTSTNVGPSPTYAWSFPGGNSTFANSVGPHTITYATAGNYTTILSVNGVSSSVNVVVTALQYENFKIGLSYDAITSKIGKSGGTFELGLVYQFDLDARKCFGCPINE
jgi:hypothetical protein